MTGAWASPAIQAAYNAAKGDITAVPPTQIQGVANGAPNGAEPAPPAEGPQFQVPYSMQTTNKIMYAPMMNYPGPSITKKNTNRLYATSHWNLATTYLPPPMQIQTITASRTVSFTTRENPVSASISSESGVSEAN